MDTENNMSEENKSKVKLNIIPPVRYLMDVLINEGYEAYLVGGAVRDSLMGNTPKDYDIATNASPEETKEIFSDKDVKVVETGIKHGTLTIIKDSTPIEVTTYRRDGVYSDGRHPDTVGFCQSIEEDLSRRDFTINAVAYNEIEGIVDPFNGMVDISSELIRCVGDPRERFSEDALRILRGLRFASSLGFDIEEDTKAALMDMKGNLNNVSKERVQRELDGILCGRAVEDVLRVYYPIIGEIIPEILPMVGFDQKTPYHIYDVWEHSIRVVSGTPPTNVLRLTALFHDIGKPPCFTQGEDGVGHFFGHPEVSYEMAGRIMRRLKYDNATRETVEILVRWHDLRPECTEKSVRKALMKVTPKLFDEWIAIKRADNWAQAPILADRQEVISEVAEIGHRLIAKEGELSLKTLNITGRDIMDLGMEEGPAIGEIMDRLLEEVLEERLLNDRDKLIDAAKMLVTSRHRK